MFCVILSFFTSSIYGQVTQEWELQPGWNAIWLGVTPAENAVADVFAGAPVESVWTYVERSTPVTFIQNMTEEPWQKTGWHRWLSDPDKGFLNNLYAVRANRPYLVKMTNNVPFTLEINGTPALDFPEWIPNSLNLRGFPIRPDESPLAGAYLAGATAHEGQALWQLAGNGRWERVASSDQLSSGEAYWVWSEGASEFVAPLEIDVKSYQGLNYADDIQELSFTVKNVADHAQSVGVVSFSGAALPLSWQRLRAKDGYVWESFENGGAVNLEAGQVFTFQLAFNRAAVGSGGFSDHLVVFDELQTMYLVPISGQSFSSTTGGLSVLSTETTHPKAGLWVGDVKITGVSEPHGGISYIYPDVQIEKDFGGEWLQVTDNQDGSFTFSGTPPAWGGTTWLSCAFDGEWGAFTEDLTIYVNDVVTKPRFVTTGLPDATVGTEYRFDVQYIEDEPYHDIYVSLPNGPAWLKRQGYDVIGGMPMSGDEGTHEVTINLLCQSEPGGSVSTNQTFLLTVHPADEAPSIISFPDPLNAEAGRLWQYHVLTDGPEQPVYRSISTSALPDWLMLRSDNDGSAWLEGVPPDSAEGVHIIDVVVTGENGASSMQSLYMAVNANNGLPVYEGLPADYAVLAGSAVERTIRMIDAADSAGMNMLAWSADLGTTRFSAPQSILANNSACWTTGDFDGDGDEDILRLPQSNYSADTNLFFANTGAGVFSPVGVPGLLPDAAWGGTLVNINAAQGGVVAIEKLSVPSSESQVVWITGMPTNPVCRAISTAMEDIKIMKGADYDMDGDQDIFYVYQNGGGAYGVGCLEYTGDSENPYTNHDVVATSELIGWTVTDMDVGRAQLSDPGLSVFLVQRQGDTLDYLRVHSCDAGSVWSYRTKFEWDLRKYVRTLDLDGDGVTELISYGPGEYAPIAELMVLAWTDTPFYANAHYKRCTNVERMIDRWMYDISSLCVGDLNSDGRDDIAFVGRTEAGWKRSLVTAHGGPGPSLIPVSIEPAATLPARMTFADLDGDSSMDVVTSDAYGVYGENNLATSGIMPGWMGFVARTKAEGIDLDSFISPPPGSAGIYEFPITLTDGENVDEKMVRVNVIDSNTPPVISGLPDELLLIEQGSVVDYQVMFSDVDQSAASLSCTEYPNNSLMRLVPESGGGVLTISVDESETPGYQFDGVITVIDSCGGETSRTVTVEVVDREFSPEIDYVRLEPGLADEPFWAYIEVTDWDMTDPDEYDAGLISRIDGALPAWITSDFSGENQGLYLSGTPSVDDVGQYPLKLVVEDDTGRRLSYPFNLVVYAPGQVSSFGVNQIQIDELVPFSITLTNTVIHEIDHRITPTPVETPFVFRMIVHVDESGQSRLLKEVAQMWQDGTYEITPEGFKHPLTPGYDILLTDMTQASRFKGSVLRNGKNVGRRISTAGYDFEDTELLMNGDFGTGALTADMVLAERSSTNPFLHRYHPDHDGVDFNPKYPELFEITRNMTLEFMNSPPDGGTDPRYGGDLLGGTFHEILHGLHYKAIYTEGEFMFRRVSRTAVLNGEEVAQ